MNGRPSFKPPPLWECMQEQQALSKVRHQICPDFPRPAAFPSEHHD
ncbi:hypothetical protein HMPREF1326_00271 [Akkermansia sp. KLE1605]|nr:hypothetical protein HMPREF1326_00271 [Akkermansia sp. KLE1605]